MVDDKVIGLLLAMASSIAIGTSTVITKMGLKPAADGTSATQNHSYLSNPVWWAGMSALIVGEVANFAAYTFAPPVMVTPLGAFSVIVGAILASILLKERLGHMGRVGCALCLLGSSIIVLHAPEDQELETVTQFLDYAVQPGFLLYCFTVCVFSLVMAYGVAPKHGRTNPLVYISIASLVGSVSVMFVKGFGVAVKLTIQGHNQFIYPSTYLFGFIFTACIVIQLNYSNRALDVFSVNLVNPMYYVGFCTATIVASLILFKGFNTTNATNTVSLLCGFIVTFLGVHVLNLSMLEESAAKGEGIVLEGGRLSLDGWRGGRDSTSGARRGSLYGVRTPLFGGFRPDVEESEDVLLHRLLEGDEEDAAERAALRREGRTAPISPSHPNIRITPRPV
ncbi:magnesium transporter NIPA-domain-containing protein [Mycena maculata]|uniref:Magnesium transporter NIPA-domain-containing protein n=1 Tax=Mycena maculata TaxID=230809 RepID=A0AAD7N6V2_9AGAR|nr:magnesium transporter NIPA-domain-containing protein [Mycena maculata]